jgi:hypothetical protein
MRLTRKRFVAAAAATGLGAEGVYELLDRLAGKPHRPETASARPVEQHLMQGVGVVVDGGVEVVVPPLHHRVITAQLKVDEGPAALGSARAAFERVLGELDADYAASPDGLTVTAAWGLPYFRRYVPVQARRAIPVDRRASGVRGREIRALEDAELFPSDPPNTILEHNDLAVLIRSDHLEAIENAHRRLFGELPELFAVTSVRKGFVGGGFGGDVSLPKRMALEGRLAGAELVPDTAELFLGFTSTQKHALGSGKIANLETLGYTAMGDGYFVGGTHMHLSHIHENLNGWYLNFDRREQVEAMFRPGLEIAPNQRTVPQPGHSVQTADGVRRDYARHRLVGHAGSMQSASRLGRDVIGADGTVYAKGTAVPHRADFNTLDNPFAWSADRLRDRMADEPDSGVHFVVFNPTSDDFRRVRLAMDGVLPDGTRLAFTPRARGQGFNSVLRTTHRQNFLVPPRAHRSFPLSELRA